MAKYVPDQGGAGFINGIGLVKFSPDGTQVKVAGFTYYKDGSEVKEDVYLLKENCPKNLTEGKFKVRLSASGGKGRKMASFYPANGEFTGKFGKLLSQENEPPKPVTRSGTYGEYSTFMMLLKLDDPDVEVPVYLPYNFSENDEGKVKYSKSFSKSEPTVFLHEVLDSIGVWDYGPITYSDNCLPEIERRAKHANKSIELVLVDGKVVKVREAITSDAWDSTPEPEFSELSTSELPDETPKLDEAVWD